MKAIVTNQDYCSYVMQYTVKAADKATALAVLAKASVPVEGRRIISDYDCTGKHFSRPLTTYDVRWSGSKRAYVVSHWWGIDI